MAFAVACSTWQAIEVWTQLEDARLGLSTYGGTVAEIYVREFLHFCASALTRGPRVEPEDALVARDTLAAILRAYCLRRGVNVLVDGMSLPAFERGPGIDWRVHVEVIGA